MCIYIVGLLFQRKCHLGCMNRICFHLVAVSDGRCIGRLSTASNLTFSVGSFFSFLHFITSAAYDGNFLILCVHNLVDAVILHYSDSAERSTPRLKRQSTVDGMSMIIHSPPIPSLAKLTLYLGSG